MSQRQAKRQRQKERRAARVEAEKRAQQRRRTLNRGILFSLIGLGAIGIFVLIARPWAGDDDDVSETSTGDTASTSTTLGETTTTLEPVPQSIDETLAGFRSLPIACGGEEPELPTSKTYSALPALAIETTDLYTVELVTSCGTIMLELDATIAPQTVNAIVFLIEEGYYDGIVFQRLAPGFVLQGGDPTATGGGNPGFMIPDELPPDASGYTAGALAMANSGANTSGSQFFIILEDATESLAPTYTLFGRVTEGMDVLDTIADIPTDPSGGGVCCRPLEAIYIESMTVTGHEPKPVPETTTTVAGTETTAGAETTTTSG